MISSISSSYYANYGSLYGSRRCCDLRGSGPQGIQGPTGPGAIGVMGPTGPTGSKTFIISHPLKSTHYLVHACLEGPESGVYYRGTATIENNKFVKVFLPDYTCAFSNFTVHVTKIIEDKEDDDEDENEEIHKEDLVCASSLIKDDGSFKIFGTNGKYDWLVLGMREKICVELSKNVEIKGEGPYTYY